MAELVKVIDVVLTLILLTLCMYEFANIFQKVIKQDSFQAVSEKNHDEGLLPPVITICPGTAWKYPGPFINDKALKDATYSWEEIFHPQTLSKLRNKSFFNLSETFSSYYGLCFTLQNLVKEKIADYSFQIVLNNAIGIIFQDFFSCIFALNILQIICFTYMVQWKMSIFSCQFIHMKLPCNI